MSIKRQTLWSLAPLLVTAAAGVFSLPMFINYLGTDMYALWNYIISFTGMFGFADLGLGVVVGRYVGVALGKQDHAAVRGYWGTGNLVLLPFLLLISLAVIGVGVWVGPHWYHVAPSEIGNLQACFVVGGCGLFLSYYGQYWLVLSQAHLDFKFIGTVRVGMTLLQILPSIVIAWLTRSPFWLLAWNAFVNLSQLAIFVWHARRHYHLGFNFGSASRARAREMAPSTGKMFAGLIVGSFFAPIDRTILGNLALPRAFSPYVFAGNVAQRLQGLSLSIMAPVLFNTCRATDPSGQAVKPAAKIYDESFAFMFEWYLLAAIWLGVWHPVLLRLWLTHSPGGGGVEKGLALAQLVGPLLAPLVAACCLTAMANVSSSQLTSLNRLGATVGFSGMAGLLAIAGVWIGWHSAGVNGAAYGFLFSRIAFVAQDLYTIRLIGAGGWLSPGTWAQIGGQGLVAALLALAYLALPVDSYWLLIPAALHGGLVALWLLRKPLKKSLADTRWFGTSVPIV